MKTRARRRGKLEDDMFGPCIESPAEEIMIAAWEAKTPAARRKGARKALATDLNCLDAYTLLAIEAETLAETLALLRRPRQRGGGFRLRPALRPVLVEAPGDHERDPQACRPRGPRRERRIGLSPPPGIH